MFVRFGAVNGELVELSEIVLFEFDDVGSEETILSLFKKKKNKIK